MDRLNAAVRRVPIWALWLAGCLPVLFLAVAVLQGALGPDPAKTMERELGLWALRFLMASLAISPLRRVGVNLFRFRRPLGLLAFAYAMMHLTVWVWPDMGLQWGQMAADLVKRPYLLFGLASALAMLPLALTSSQAAVRRMGAAAWTRLHRLAYLALVLGLLHFVALSRVWTVELLVYGVLGLGLLLLRLVPKTAKAPRVAEAGR